MGRPKGSKNGQRTLIEFTCERCGKSFSRQPSTAQSARYCSMQCYKPKAKTLQCERCGKSYTRRPGERDRFCSNECRRNRVEKVCLGCGKTIQVRASKAHKYNYCSMECKRAHSPVSIECAHCGKSFTVYKARGATAKYCSKICLNDAKRQQFVAIICKHCGKEKLFPQYRVIADNKEFCGNRCATLYRMDHGFDPGYIGNKRRNGYRTDIEALTEAVLLQLGIPYMFEHKVGRYSVDFLLPMIGIALECDGWQHKTVKGRERDAKRDKALADEGWIVVHMDDTEIRRSAMDCVRTALSPHVKL